MIDECLLTTLDNMYDPFTKPDEWREYDVEKGYFSNEWLARFSKASSKMTDEQYDQETSDAIDRFLAINPFGIHYKLRRSQASWLIPLANKVYQDLYVNQTPATD